MEKFKELLYFLFIRCPFIIATGVSFIILYNEKPVDVYFECVKIRKKKKSIDKKKFAKLMERITK